MSFNLITTPWLEARRASGTRVVVRPGDITDAFGADPILALDFPRPDWNAALTEFLIGLTFLALAPEDAEDWGESFRVPPTPTTLHDAFAPFATAFDLDGDGPRAFQDFDPLDTADIKPLSSLLIDAPGENTLKNNADLFVKRDGSQTLSLAQAAAALITLQTYAPSGGAGHRTSMRGGGPLTTLLAPVRKSSDKQSREVSTLWDRVWANVPERSAAVGQAGLSAVFPWLVPTITSEKDGRLVTPEDRHPALAFFACPRRIRLEFAADAVATGYRTLNYGANYLHWLHPLSPYRDDKVSGKLPLHPNAGASDYGDWLAWWGFNGTPALPLVLWKERRAEAQGSLAWVGLEAVGYDMDNMKARQWLDARFPWVPVHDQARGALKATLHELIGGADAAARAVRFAAKIALFGQAKDSGYRLPDTLSMDALKEPGERLWSETQTPFEGLLGNVVELLKDGPQPTIGYKEAWLKTLRGCALKIFDETVDLEGMSAANPRRLLYARDQLAFAFADHPKAAVRKALGLSATVKPAKTKEAA
jgi:CRISPR system Cascade subunit CasA